ncbi:hypothetical protein LCGC14_1442960 [marine sediment metagenome]|uniref:Uncharacterized protein n=1 Tax=marine sediment metagenome TaxID=412755 RepID=A0A0F9MM17_9ZZZZ
MTTIPYKKTGCKILDSHGITMGTSSKEARILCLDCPLDDCVLERNEMYDEPVPEEPIGEDVEVICESCGTLETLTYVEGKLGKHPRFTETHHLTNGGICGKIRIVKT